MRWAGSETVGQKGTRADAASVRGGETGMILSMRLRRLGIGFLLAQAVGAVVWWALLLVWPALHTPFLVKGAPDATLLAFVLPDALLFIGTSGACAYGFWRKRPWAWPLLCVHAGAAGYAALYCWALVALTGGEGLPGALMMSPSLVVPGILVWRLRPTGGDSC